MAKTKPAAENSGDQQKAKGKPRGRPFPKGQSGNPAGRPKDLAEVREYARAKAAGAIDQLERIGRQKKNHVAAVMANEAILTRGFGKPAQTVELPDGKTALSAGVIILPAEIDG